MEIIHHRKTAFISIVFLTLSLFTSTAAWAEDQVLTLYFLGTGIKDDASTTSGYMWDRHELLTTMFWHYDQSEEMTPTDPMPGEDFQGTWAPVIDPPGIHVTHRRQHKYLINGAGTSPRFTFLNWVSMNLGKMDPELGVRSWAKIIEEGQHAVWVVHANHPNDNLIVNLVGFSRGGISIMQMARALIGTHWGTNYDFVTKINMLAFDPVPGGFDPIGNFSSYDFSLPQKVNQFVGLYAEHERTYMFEPVIPEIPESNTTTKMLLMRLPGSHETMMGNRQRDGHAFTDLTGLLDPALGIIEDDRALSGYGNVEDVSLAIAVQLLTSHEWGEVPFNTSEHDWVDLENSDPLGFEFDKDSFNQLITTMWAQNYNPIKNWGFYAVFGTVDACYRNMGRDNQLRSFSVLLPVNHSRLAFKAGQRHEPEWAWSFPCVLPYAWYWNVEQVYWLDDEVLRVDETSWDTLQSFRGTPTAPVDILAPVPNIDVLPDIVGECSVDVTSPPSATDNVDGTVTGETTYPTNYVEQGLYVIAWTYTDEAGNVSTQNQTVIVEDTISPILDEEPLAVVQGECSAEITSIPTAIDNCAGAITGYTSDPLSYDEQGNHVVTWNFDDGNGNTTTQQQTVIVKDITSPEITNIIASPNVLLPPNHKMATVTVDVTIVDNCDEAPISIITSVSSNESENSRGDGNTTSDWLITGNRTVELRAERSGRGSDRVYTVTVEGKDAAENSTTATVIVTVPHDQGKKKGKQ